MSMSRIMTDLLEVVAVFLLAVEAIKVENLASMRSRASSSLFAYLNPTVEIAEELPKDATFTQRWAIEIFLLGLYLCGSVALVLGAVALHAPLLSLLPQTAAGWLLGMTGIIFVPFLVGLVLYSGLVSLVAGLIHALSWIEAHTHTGAVGVLGFTFYLIQFVARRVLAL